MDLRGKRARHAWEEAESEEEPVSISADDVELEGDCSSDDDSRKGRCAISWKGSLEARFLKALQQAGGVWEAKPKAILQKMGAYASQLTTIQVKSHLQKHRIKVASDMQRQGAGSSSSMPGTTGGGASAPLQQARQAAQLAVARQQVAVSTPHLQQQQQQQPKKRRSPKQGDSSQPRANPKLAAQQRQRLVTAGLPPVSSATAPPTPPKPSYAHDLLHLRHSGPAFLVDTASSGNQPSPTSGGSSSGGASDHHTHQSASYLSRQVQAAMQHPHHLLHVHVHHSQGHGSAHHMQMQPHPQHYQPQQAAVHLHQQLHTAHLRQQQQPQFAPALQHTHAAVYLAAQQGQQHHRHLHPQAHAGGQHLLPLRHGPVTLAGTAAYAPFGLEGKPSSQPPAIWAPSGTSASLLMRAPPSPLHALPDSDGGWVDHLLGMEPLPLDAADGGMAMAAMGGPVVTLPHSAAPPPPSGHRVPHANPGSDSDSDHFHTDFGDLLDLPVLRFPLHGQADDGLGGLCGLDGAAQGGWGLDGALF